MRKITFLLIFNFLILIPILDLQAVVIRLYPEARVSGLRVELGTIADIESEDGEIVKKLKKVYLMPLPYREKIITLLEIQTRLSYHFKDDFIFIGDKIKIKPVFTRILETEIMEKIRSAVLKKFPELSYDKMEIMLLDSVSPIKIPYGEIEIKPQLPQKDKMTDIHFVRTDILVDNTLYTSRSFRVKLSVKKS